MTDLPETTAAKILLLANDIRGVGGVQAVARASVQALREHGRNVRTLSFTASRPGSLASRVRRLFFQLQVNAAIRTWKPSLVLCDHLYTARFARRAGAARFGFWAHLIELDCRSFPMHKDTGDAAHFILCNSHFTAGELARLHPSWAAKAKTVQLGAPAGAEATGPFYERNLCQQRLLMVGRMDASEQYKGHDIVLEAIASSESLKRSIDLRIVGDGSDRARLEQRCRYLGLEDVVIFTGRISNEALEKEWQQATGLLLPSAREGFGLVFLDALRHGIPVLALKNTVAEEVLDECGVFTENTVEGLREGMANILSGNWIHSVDSVERFCDRFTYKAFADRLTSALTSLSAS